MKTDTLQEAQAFISHLIDKGLLEVFRLKYRLPILPSDWDKEEFYRQIKLDNPSELRKFLENPQNTSQKVSEQNPESKTISDKRDGWIKIESEDDLPKEPIGCFFVTDYSPDDVKQGWYYAKYFSLSSEEWEWSHITHYQPIIKPQPPIF